MASIPKEIQTFMQKWEVEPNEVWQVPGGKAYAVKHSALERIAAQSGFVFDMPDIIEAKTEERIVTVLVRAHDPKTQASTWSFGEASPANNKNAYCWSMAEKRAKDRCILKLLSIHGVLYSEDEMKDAGEPPAYQERSPEPDYAPPGEPVAPPLLAGPEALARHVTNGLEHPPGKNKPPHWDAITKLVDGATDYTDLTYQMSQPFYKNTTSGWSNHYRRELGDKHIVPKVAEFRGSEVAIKLQSEIHAKYPLDTFSRQQEAAE